MRKIFRYWKVFLLVLILLGAGGFWRYRQVKAANKPIKTITAQRKTLEKKIEVSGIIDAKEKAVLRFANGGKLTYLNAKEGDWIKRYQAIARIDARELQKRLQQDLNAYFNERMDFEQNKEDRRDKAPTNYLNRQNQKDQKDLETEVLDVEIRDIAIKNTLLTSPIEGILISSPTQVSGVTLLPSDTFEIINPSTLVFRAAVDEADIALVHENQTAQIELDAYENQKITTGVNYISFKSSQNSTGTVFIVEMPIHVDDGAAGLAKYRLGMNGDADILVAKKEDALVLPLNTTKERDGKTFVTVKTGEKTTEEREITVGLENDEEIEVLSGITGADQVVLPE